MRAVLSAILAAALLGASMPAVDGARAERTAASVEAELDSLGTAAREIAASDPVPRGTPGATRTVRLTFPEASLATAAVLAVRIGCRGEPCRRPLAYRLRGRGPVSLPLRGVRLAPSDGPVVLRSPGPHRLRLSLLEGPAGPAIRVERVDDDPTETAE